MVVASWYSAAHVVTSTATNEAIYAFELIWISQFWPPDAVHADGVFHNEAFQSFLAKYDIQLRPVPPRRPKGNMIVTSHGVIRSIFVRLCHSNITESAAVLAIQSVRISNDLYGNDVVSSFELAKGFTCPPVLLPAILIYRRSQTKFLKHMWILLRNGSWTNFEIPHLRHRILLTRKLGPGVY